MALLASITFANVLVRYFTNRSFACTEEISVFLMIVLALVAGSAAVARNCHIRIEYFADKGSSQRKRGLARFAAIIVFILFALLAVWKHCRLRRNLKSMVLAGHHGEALRHGIYGGSPILPH
jgi:TRAP-type C4-dicarboxylate transport system permease small subunit